MKPEIPEVEPEIPQSALSIYDQDGAQEDFPVLKAFQQYIDAEQEKARKRMLSMAVFFGVFTILVIAVFVVLLMHVSERNQSLNDRLVEFAMRERAQPMPAAANTPVVVQPPQDNSAILALTAKLDEMQKKLAESQAKSEREAKEAALRAEKAAIEAAKPKMPTKEELEIQRLKEQIEAHKKAEAERIEQAKEKAKLEKEKARLEKEAKRQAELEEYRRKHYPELYQKPAAKPKVKRVVVQEFVEDEDEDEIEVKSPSKASPSKSSPTKVDQLLKELDDMQAIKYFDDEEEKDNSIPVDKGSSNRSWNIPEEE